MSMPVYAILIVTRNRPVFLASTLDSIQKQDVTASVRLLVVDASDPAEAEKNRSTISQFEAGETIHILYPDAPSTARQRNFGFDRLPEDTEVVFLLDDDVELTSGYLQTLGNALVEDRTLGAIGGLKLKPDGSHDVTPSGYMWLRRFFCLDHPKAGRLLLSGCTSPANGRPVRQRTDVEWLSGFGMALRREVVDSFRTDAILTGYSLHEDLDFTYRIGKEWRLAIDPSAGLIHHNAPSNRFSRRDYAMRLLIHRYWIVEKNIRHPLKKPAFWWATLGQMLLLTLSRNPSATDVRKGITRAIPVVLRRMDPILAKRPEA